MRRGMVIDLKRCIRCSAGGGHDQEDAQAGGHSADHGVVQDVSKAIHTVYVKELFQRRRRPS